METWREILNNVKDPEPNQRASQTACINMLCCTSKAFYKMVRSLNFVWEQKKSAFPRAIRRVPPSCMDYFCKHGHISCINYVLQLGVKLTHSSLCAAASAGQLSVLKLAKESGLLQVSSSLMEAAAISGHIELTSYLRINGAEFTEKTFEAAVQSGSVELVQYLLDNNCRPRRFTICLNNILLHTLLCVQITPRFFMKRKKCKSHNFFCTEET